MTIEITKEAFIQLVGNDEKTWLDYKSNSVSEESYYYNFGVIFYTSTSFITKTTKHEITKYYIQDIKVNNYIN